MDPNKNLAEQRQCRELVEKLRVAQAGRWDAVHRNEMTAASCEQQNDIDRDLIANAHFRIADLAVTLDMWLSGGGVLPKDWQR